MKPLGLVSFIVGMGVNINLHYKNLKLKLIL